MLLLVDFYLGKVVYFWKGGFFVFVIVGDDNWDCL